MKVMSKMSAAAVVFFAAAAMGLQSPATRPASIPASEQTAKAALEKSPRHGEWAEFKVGDRTVRAWVVYPEVKDKAGVVILIHEIYGLSDWIRAVADQAAADGFIAVAPDFLSGAGPNGGGTEAFPSRDDVVKGVRGLKPDDVAATLDAARDFAAKLPSSNGKCATLGFCWGGSASFAYAARQPALDAAVVYYGTSPADRAALEKIKAPVMGFYGGDDARVTSTVKPAEDAMKSLGKPYTPHVYEGAGHGFLRQQEGRNGANLKAAEAAWKDTIAFLRERLK